MRYFLLTNLVLLASLILGACSSDDEETQAQETQKENKEVQKTTLLGTPLWQMDWSFNDERPNWQEPSARDFENFTVLLLQIEDRLAPYVSDDDMMAVYLDHELRGLAKPAIYLDGQQHNGTDTISYFVVKVYGNESEQTRLAVALRYYCSKLHHIFTLQTEIDYAPDEIYGIDSDIIPTFIDGQEKYPYERKVQINDIIATSGITPADGDIVAAFLGDECRGLAHLSELDAQHPTFTVYGSEEDEVLTLKYYDADVQTVFTFPDAISIKNL